MLSSSNIISNQRVSFQIELDVKSINKLTTSISTLHADTSHMNMLGQIHSDHGNRISLCLPRQQGNPMVISETLYCHCYFHGESNP